MRVLGVVPARGGSTRIPRKNLERLAGYSLVNWALHTARGSAVSSWVLSTDDISIAAEAANDVPLFEEALFEECWLRVHPRPAGDDGPMAELLNRVLVWTGDTYDAVCCVQPTSPLRTAFDIDSCVALLRNSPSCSAVSIDESTGLRNGAVFVTRVSMLRDGLVYDEHSLKYPMPHDRSVDINTPEDLELARRLWKEQHG